MTEPTNPYKAPSASVDDGARGAFSWRVALLAGCAGFGAAYTIGSVVSPLWQHWLVSTGVPFEQLYGAFGASLPLNLVAQALTVFAGALSGYLAARYCTAAPLLHAAAATVPMYVATLAGHLGVYPSPFPLWSNLLSLLLPIPCAFAGVNLFRRSRKP